jgi:integrase/recombinase XerD
MKLQSLIDQFVAFRQTLGERFETNGKILRAFARAAGGRTDVTQVTPGQVIAFIAGAGPVTTGWYGRYQALRGFYCYALSRGYVAVMPLPVVVPKPPPAFVPYIYSRDELRGLLKAIPSCLRARHQLEPDTVRVIILLLYGAGLRVGEALALSRADVDIGAAVITVRQAKFFKTRLVPLSLQLAEVLAEYARRCQPPDLRAARENPFFITRTNRHVHRNTLGVVFRSLCVAAGVRRPPEARYQPRMHDLRHTFAVHRLTAWYREGADVQKLLPQLSVYLGHACLAATQVYLSMTPELLHEAGVRFERYARKEECND